MLVDTAVSSGKGVKYRDKVTIHGIRQSDLGGAPSLDEVKKMITYYYHEFKDSVICGHDVINVLKAIWLTGVIYIDTQEAR